VGPDTEKLCVLTIILLSAGNFAKAYSPWSLEANADKNHIRVSSDPAYDIPVHVHSLLITLMFMNAMSGCGMGHQFNGRKLIKK